MKIAKLRVSVMAAASQTGEKLKLLVIGTAKSPHCFKNIDKKNLPVLYNHTKKAWMTGKIFEEWILEVNQSMKKQKRSIIMFVDNAPSHKVSKALSNV